MKIVAFGHRKRTGKDAAGGFLATILKQHTHLNIFKTSFAYKLKDIAHQLYSWDGLGTPEYYEKYPDLREMTLPTIGKTPREIWIDLGTPAIRECVYDGTWVEYCLRDNNKNTDILIITDLRFPNEFNMVKELDGICIKVHRDNVEKSDDIADIALAHVPDEEWSQNLYNNGSLGDLYAHMDALAKVLTDG